MDDRTYSEWKKFHEKHINPPPLTIHIIVNSAYNASALLDSGYLCYALVSKEFAI
jgi:hypothetical protein